MSNSSILFSSDRNPRAASSIERPDEIIQESLAFVGVC
jgi:hypothetical protein